MTEEEVEIVAEELAKMGGTAWYPGRGQGPVLRVVTDRHRDQARAAIEALDRMRTSDRPDISPDAQDQAGTGERKPGASRTPGAGSGIRPGATVIYRPAGDRRACPYRVVEIRGSQAYLEPILRICIGWISIEHLRESPDEENPGRS